MLPKLMGVLGVAALVVALAGPAVWRRPSER